MICKSYLKFTNSSVSRMNKCTFTLCIYFVDCDDLQSEVSQSLKESSPKHAPLQRNDSAALIRDIFPVSSPAKTVEKKSWAAVASSTATARHKLIISGATRGVNSIKQVCS